MKTIVVTGATSGIGKEVALQLLKSGHRVIAIARNLEKADQVKKELAESSENHHLHFFEADFANFQSVLGFAQTVKTNYSSIDVLINNAGTWEMKFTETSDGIETNLQVNHLSPMLLTLELLPLLKKGGNGRIVNTSSGAHRRNILDLDDPEWRKKPYDGVATYSQSKLFNILFSLQLVKKLNSHLVTVNTVHPGYVKTSLFDKMGSRDWTGIPTAAEGARGTLYATLSDDLEGISGKYLFQEHEDPGLSTLAKDEKLAEKVWEMSVKYLAGKSALVA